MYLFHPVSGWNRYMTNYEVNFREGDLVMDCEIIFEDNTKLADIEGEDRGYRSDIIVRIGNRSYQIYVTSLIRLQQDFETEFEYKGYFQSEPNMVLVQNTTRNEIIETIKKMYECGYFEALDNFGFYPSADT